MSASGLLILDKPAGLTSHDVVSRARRLLGTRKIGHAGTLDPMATGVLVLGVGRATRLLGYISGADKSYSATIRLGASTVTDDAEGEIVATADPAALAAISIESVLSGVALLTGEIEQVPSSVSAIKVDGRRAYARVRAGDEVVLESRVVTVSEFAVIARRFDQQWIDLDVHVVCSSGTYIRALARDLGAELGVGGHLTALRRTRVGPWLLAEASTMDEFTEAADPASALLPLEVAAARVFPTWVVAAQDATYVRNGRRIDWSYAGDPAPVLAVFDEDGAFLALAERHGPTAKYLAVFV